LAAHSRPSLHDALPISTISAGSEGGEGQIHDPVWWKLLLGNTYLAVLWLPLRFYVGQAWLTAGEHKVRDGAWMDGGTALQGYWTDRKSTRLNSSHVKIS